MIVYEQSSSFCFITQHDHAHASGTLAEAWNPSHFKGLERRNDVLYAVYEHDRGWIDLDASPFWDIGQGAPYSFWNYPFPIKKHFYRMGIEEVESANPYAGLLSSLQYCKVLQFISHEPDVALFIRQETIRQERMKRQLGITGELEEQLAFHLALLRYCDDLSVYLCIHPPGIEKNRETWFRHGLTETFDFSGGRPSVPS